MCLAIPVEIIELKDNKMAVVEAGGIRKVISIQFLSGVKQGDYVLLHAGFAIQKIDQKQAEETLRILREIAGI